MINSQNGDICFSYNPESFWSKLVRFFTGGPWSHCFSFFPEIAGQKTLIESNMTVSILSIDIYAKTADVWEIYRPIKASKEDIDRANLYLLNNTSGVIYGVFQRYWFIIDWALNKIGFRSKRKNFWPHGIICSEALYLYIRELGGEYAQSVSHLSENKVDPDELYLVIRNRLDLWLFIDNKEYPRDNYLLKTMSA